MAQRIQEITVGTWVQIRGSKSTGGVRDKNIADTIFDMHIAQLCLYRVSDIYHFIFTFCPDGYCSHNVDRSHLTFGINVTATSYTIQ